MKYVFRSEFQTFKGAASADPQVIGAELERIAREGGGEITPDAVVDAARDDKSVIHRHFEWDDATAAEKYRLDQARMIIRSVTIVRDDISAPVQAFVSLNGSGGRSYRPIDTVLGSRELRMSALAQARRDLEAFKSRYRDLTDVIVELASASEKIDEHISRESA